MEMHLPNLPAKISKDQATIMKNERINENKSSLAAEGEFRRVLTVVAQFTAPRHGLVN